MAMTLLQRWAAQAPVRLYVVLGIDALERYEALNLEPLIEPVASPRDASLLLIAGRIPAQLWPALQRLHDQLPHPRASLYWGEPPLPLPDAEQIPGDATPTEALRRIQQDLLSGRRRSSPDLLPDTPPAPWQGEGEHGQGGEGMMGGKPYGRSMAMSDADLRDGLALDGQNVSLGPFAPMLPTGLSMRLSLQGDVIQQVEFGAAPFADASSLEAFQQALHEEVPLARLERLRAAHHLHCIARLLLVRGSAMLARRLLDAARRIGAGGTIDVARLRRWLRLSGLQHTIEPGLGAVDRERFPGLCGPALRASGVAEDLRSRQAPYRAAGFRTITHGDGDVRARIAQWLAEAGQSLLLANSFGDARRARFSAVETPAGPLDATGYTSPLPDAADLERLLSGLEWSQAMTVLASFDVELLSRLRHEADS